MNNKNTFAAMVVELAREIDAVAKPYRDEKQRTKYPISDYSDIDRRLIVKSIFSFIEGVIFELKRVAVIMATEKTGLLLPEEIAMAKDEDYELDESGKIKMVKAKLRFKSNFRFAFNLFVKSAALDQKTMPDLAGNEWGNLVDSLKIRDRITHPKSISDLEITDKEIQKVLRSYDWVYAQMFIVVACGLQKSMRDKSKTI
jgi:hypothetical protein